MSRHRARMRAKRRRRRLPQLTPEQRVEIQLHAMRAYQAAVARADRRWLETVECMAGEDDRYRRPKRNEFDNWELAELLRRNHSRANGMTMRLAGGAYEARKLGRYCGWED